MSSGSAREVFAVFRKEAQGEFRGRSGLVTAGLFGLVAVVAVSFGTSAQRLEPTVAAGLLWVTLMFAAVIALPRALTLEEEQGTGDLLRVLARPSSVYWGKVSFNLAQTWATQAALTGLFLIFVGVGVTSWPLMVVSLIGGGAAVAGAVTLCGALVAHAQHRTILAGAISLPLLLPLVAIAVGATRVAFGGGLWTQGWMAAAGLGCYALATLAIGPLLFAAVWRQ